MSTSLYRACSSELNRPTKSCGQDVDYENEMMQAAIGYLQDFSEKVVRNWAIILRRKLTHIQLIQFSHICPMIHVLYVILLLRFLF